MPKRKENLVKEHGRDVVVKFADLAAQINTHKPAPEDIKALQRLLDEHPQLWRAAGDLVYLTARSVIDKHTSNPVLKMSLEYGWEELRQDLGYQNAPPLEQMLIEQLLLAWLHLITIESDYINTVNQSFIAAETIMLWEKRLNAAQQRYLRAAESLARIRKLTRNTPALQVNIAANGGQQINGLHQTPDPVGRANGKG